MRRIALLVMFVVIATACVRPADTLVFLTRTGCVQTYEMRQHLDAAIVKVGWRGDYEVINLSSLTGDDPRKGYPTPTVLYRGRDLFGRETPMPAPGDPT
jgi:hypothetical protein